MSDDNRRDRALQRRVRERQAKTGENYQAAWQQLAASEAPSARELSQGPHDESRNIHRIPLPLCCVLLADRASNALPLISAPTRDA